MAYLACDSARADGSLAAAERAARLLGAAEALSQVVRLPIPPADQADLAAYNQTVASLRALLGENRLDALSAEGEAMGWEHAATYALDAPAATKPGPFS